MKHIPSVDNVDNINDNNELYEHICADVIRVIDDRKSTIREIIAIAYK